MPAAQNNKVLIGNAGFNLRYPSMSVDNRLLSYVACEPGMDTGELYVQSSFLREMDTTAAIASNVTCAAVWYDPTPPVFE